MKARLKAVLGVAALGVAAFLSGCLLGGTGTGTGNGVDEEKPNIKYPTTENGGVSLRYRDAAGQPMAGLHVVILPTDFSPLRSASAQSVNVPAESLITDTAGRLPAFRFLNPGTYVATALANGQAIALDTLAVSDARHAAKGELTTQTPMLWRGKVTLESRLLIDSGWIVVRGTPFKAKVDSAGQYELGHLPSDLRRRAAVVFEKYAARPFAVSEAVLQTKTSDIVTSDTTGTKTPSTLPGGATPPDTIQVVSSELSSSFTKPDSLLKVQCVQVVDTVSGASRSVCLEKDTLTYRNQVPISASDVPKTSLPDTTKPVYLENGKVLPSCTASTRVKTSDDLVQTPGGGEGDFTVLDVSAEPACLAD